MRRVLILSAIVGSALLAGAGPTAQAPESTMFGGRPLVHAHNAYPEDGKWRDRISRALAIEQRPLVVEQDIAFAPGTESHLRTVVSHEAKLHGSEPTLEAHFFDRIRPLIERELAAARSDRWPAIVLHLDFKSNEREHHRAVWDLLRRHRSWLTTAKAGGDAAFNSVERGPLLVLTENGANQERDFVEWSAAEGSLLLFGSIRPPAVPQSDDPAERARILHHAAPNELIPTGATSYRRWVNFSWGVIEAGGPANAGEWTDEDRRRLDSIVEYAHRQGLLIRFYTLNGHSASASLGWTPSYNFGSLDAVRERWRAAIEARVDLIATDQYEDLAALITAK